ncbi:MAG: phosphatase PAP2 family protein [Prevotella sp.]|nr:phosphatase PAP2 family protein [Prevotella sp.]
MDFTSLIEFDKQLLLSVNGSESLFLDGLVKTLTTASTWIPLYGALLYMVIKNNDRAQKVLMIVGAALLCVFLAGSLDDMFVKPMVARWRPSHDPAIGMYVDIVNDYRGGSYGFFSAHASNTFSIAIFFALLVRNRIFTVSMVLWSLVNCWTRMYLGVHYPGDILVGLLWGGLVGTAVWYLHLLVTRQFTTTKTYISTQYTSTGYDIQDLNVVISVLLMTCIYAVLKACYFVYI